MPINMNPTTWINYMSRKNSILDDLMTLPWWFNLVLAAIVYFGLKYYVPTIEFKSPAFQSIGKAFPNRPVYSQASLSSLRLSLPSTHGERENCLTGRPASNR